MAPYTSLESRAAAGILFHITSTREATMNWREELAAAFLKKREEKAEKGFHEQQIQWETNKFFDEVVQPALNAIAVELRKNGRVADIKRLPSSIQISSAPVVYTVGVSSRRLAAFIEIELFGRKSHTIRTALMGEGGRALRISETTQDHIAAHFVDTYTKYI